jgi:hypothetical protein
MTKLPRELNNALQVRLAEYGLSLREIPELPRMIEHLLSGTWETVNFVAGLNRILLPRLTAIPRKGARGGHEYVGTPEERARVLVDEILTIMTCSPKPPTAQIKPPLFP